MYRHLDNHSYARFVFKNFVFIQIYYERDQVTNDQTKEHLQKKNYTLPQWTSHCYGISLSNMTHFFQV